MVLTVQADHETPQLRVDKVVDAGRRSLVVVQRLILMVQTVCRTIEFHPSAGHGDRLPVVQVVLTFTCTVFGVRLRSTRCGFSGR